MKKINALLHEVTLINFALLARLTKRYKLASLIASIGFFASVFYFHFSQTTIHSKKVFFKVHSPEEISITKKLDDYIGDLSSKNENEVKSMLSNFKFLRTLAERLVASPKFDRLDFNNPAINSLTKPLDLFRDCKNVACKVDVLEGYLPILYDIDTEIGTGRFILTATTRSPETTFEFLRHFIAAIREIRLEIILQDYDTQITQTEELIQLSRNDINNKGGFDKLAVIESLQALIERQTEKMKDIVVRINAETNQNNYQEIRLKTSESTAGTRVDSENKREFEEYQKLTTNIERLKLNINSLKSIPVDSRSPTDKLILEQLISDLKINEDNLKKIGRIKRDIARDQKFIETQMSNQVDFEFDYKITRQKLQKLRQESDQAKEELDKLLLQKATLDNELLALKPDLEYLKKLEAKMVSLKMMKSGARADISFEDYGPDIRSFRRNSLSKIVSFSFFLWSFFLMITLVIIYLFDDRIFDEYELKKCCNDLKVIGVAPNFD